jgi:hypothetical protein
MHMGKEIMDYVYLVQQNNHASETFILPTPDTDSCL